MKKPLEVLQLYAPHDYTLNGAYASRAACAPERPFVLYGDTTWSWQAFEDEIRKAALLLIERGIVKGDRVAVMGRNSDGHVLMLFALARIGAIMVPVNPEFGIEETRYVLHHAEVSGVVAGTDELHVAREASTGLARAPWFLTLDQAQHGVPALSDVARNATLRALPEDITADDTFLIVYTSGTTGFPKGAMHTQKSFVTAG